MHVDSGNLKRRSRTFLTQEVTELFINSPSLCGSPAIQRKYLYKIYKLT